MGRGEEASITAFAGLLKYSNNLIISAFLKTIRLKLSF